MQITQVVVWLKLQGIATWKTDKIKMKIKEYAHRKNRKNRRQGQIWYDAFGGSTEQWLQRKRIIHHNNIIPRLWEQWVPILLKLFMFFNCHVSKEFHYMIHKNIQAFVGQNVLWNSETWYAGDVVTRQTSDTNNIEVHDTI